MQYRVIPFTLSYFFLEIIWQSCNEKALISLHSSPPPLQKVVLQLFLPLPLPQYFTHNGLLLSYC